MSRSFQFEKPPSRIDIKVDPADQGGQEKIELPFRVLVLGNFTGDEPDEAVEDREVISVNKNNFEAVLKESNLNASFVVKDRLSGEEDAETRVNLKFESMSDFEPEQVARQVPQLKRLLAVRGLLEDLKARLISGRDFRKKLQEIIQDETAFNNLLAELNQVVKDKEDAE